MATVTKPIALDESLNTTELSSRNVADVLAQELSAVATAIGGISAPSAEDVSYDNSGSGLSATDVQNALDEIVSDIPTVNNGTLTIQQNGTSKGSFTANSASNVNVNIETPTADKKTATDQFTTADGGLLSKCMINLVPVQSGSGDPSPDNVRPISGHTEVDLYNVGKNRFPITVNSIKTSNGGTWTNNSRTISGITVSILTDIYNNVIGVKLNGTSTNQVVVNYCDIIVNDFVGMKFNGYSGNTTSSEYAQMITYYNAGGEWANETYQANNTDKNISNYAKIRFGFLIRSGQTLNNVIVYPMVRTASETDSTFEPYLGHLYQVQIGSTVYGGYVDLVSGEGKNDTDKSNNGITNTNTTYSNLDYGVITKPNNSSDYNVYEQTAIINSSHFKIVEYPLNLNDASLIGCIFGSASRYQWWCGFDKGTSLADMQSATSGIENVYELATPQTIQLTPQQIETLAGQNNLSTPLSGQSIETNGVEYKELFTFADAEKVLDTVGAENITSEFTKSSDCTWENNYTRIVKWGRRIDFYLRFTTPSTISSDKLIITVPDKYKPSSLFNTIFIMGSVNKLWDGSVSGIVGYSSNTGGITLISNGWVAGTNVGFYGSYYI